MYNAYFSKHINYCWTPNLRPYAKSMAKDNLTKPVLYAKLQSNTFGMPEAGYLALVHQATSAKLDLMYYMSSDFLTKPNAGACPAWVQGSLAHL